MKLQFVVYINGFLKELHEPEEKHDCEKITWLIYDLLQSCLKMFLVINPLSVCRLLV